MAHNKILFRYFLYEGNLSLCSRTNMYDRTRLIEQIKSKMSANLFEKRISSIRFPLYRNLLPNTKITFDFPLTVFVGLNGHGKSSTLQALYGCPQGYSVGKYWFSSKVDPIEESPQGPQCFIYDYPSSTTEVLKQRTHRAKNPNYWETSRPLKKYGMKTLPDKSRDSGIKMDVLYLDFRSILPAFDKYFYFEKPKKRETAQYINDRSRMLHKALTDGKIYRLRGTELNKNPRVLSEEVVDICSKILGKTYSEIKIIDHKFYKSWGFTIYFSEKHGYSEAVAGSGESAVVLLVDYVLNASENTLILLDEPEVSLHPGAQSKMLDFLLKQTLEKNHQIILSTHSHSFVDGLPDNAIKVFKSDPGSSKFIIEPEVPSGLAFYELGAVSPSHKKIIVEDRLAKSLICKVLENEFGAHITDLISVDYQLGGATYMKKSMTQYFSYPEQKVFFILDGDQKIVDSTNPETLTAEQCKDSAFLKEKIQLQMGQSLGLPTEGENVANTQVRFLKFWYDRVSYLPLETPEDILWDIEFARAQLRLLYLNEDDIESCISSYEKLDIKSRFAKLTKDVLNEDSSDKILNIQELALARWARAKPSSYCDVLGILRHIISS